jgi:CheY-like chemotaxis protein
VRIIAERAGSSAVLRVIDEGVGLPPEMLDRVFDLFVQQPQMLDRSKGGLGLGLAIVRSLVGMHGGKVFARSDGAGKGSEFIVELPLAAEELALDESGRLRLQGAPSGVAGAQRSDRILVVDDNHDAAESVADLLRELGHEVIVAYDGPSALEIARTCKPRICLVDIGLPVMDGYELAARLRASGDLAPGARIVALTGYGQDSDRRRSIDAGFDAHLVKPVSLDVLTKAVLN